MSIIVGQNHIKIFFLNSVIFYIEVKHRATAMWFIKTKKMP